jgi:integrase
MPPENCTQQSLPSNPQTLENGVSATLQNTGQKRGPVPKRRFQEGTFIKDRNGSMYVKYYIDVVGPDGAPTTKQVKKFLGNISQISERSARREYARIMEDVNAKRGSVAPAPKGQSFTDAVNKWRAAIAPNLSPATVRQRDSHFRAHILPRFEDHALHELGVHELQQFATDLRQSVSRPTTIGILCTVFGVLDYAERCKMRVSGVKPADIELGAKTERAVVPFFTREQAALIIGEAREPFKTLFTLAWNTGMSAGELLALSLDDLDFTNKTIRVNKAADDNTRIVRQPKTKCSNAVLPMPSALEAVLRNYIRQWKPNPDGILFATRDGLRPRSRDNVVKNGLKPVLRRLGIPDKDTGLHAFRHGLATQLVEASVPLSVLQKQLRHADVATTLRIYTHAISQSQRDAMENIGGNPISTSISTVLRCASK